MFDMCTCKYRISIKRNEPKKLDNFSKLNSNKTSGNFFKTPFSSNLFQKTCCHDVLRRMWLLRRITRVIACHQARYHKSEMATLVKACLTTFQLRSLYVRAYVTCCSPSLYRPSSKRLFGWVITLIGL